MASLTPACAPCPVCLVALKSGDADSPGSEQDVLRCHGCKAPFHRLCVAGTSLAAAERAQLPLCCPVPGCGQAWGPEVVRWALSPEELQRFDAAAEALNSLRSAARTGREDSPRTVEALTRLGVRACPRCCAMIQKQAEGLLTGCDKMTCRCGCMFCFKCGLEARSGGAARCRCVGAHHGYIPQRDVLNNYGGSRGALSMAADQDLVKRPKGPASKGASARLRKEFSELRRQPPPFVQVSCDESNILHWDFLIEGPPETPYAGGLYWGYIDAPKDYPFWPPLIRICTPNGRFEADAWLCRTQVDYHPEGWQPPWTISALLIALLALMCDDCFTSGIVHPPASDFEKRALALQSIAWNAAKPAFRKAFPHVCTE